MGMTNKPPAKPRIRLTLSFRCEENWEAMENAGPDARHCRVCDKNVIDLTGKTAGEVMALYAENGGSLCGRGLYDTVRDEFVLPNVRQVAQRAALAGALAASAGCVDEGVTASRNNLTSDDGGTDGSDYDDSGATWNDPDRTRQGTNQPWLRTGAGGTAKLGDVQVAYVDPSGGNAPDAGSAGSTDSSTTDTGTGSDSSQAEALDDRDLQWVAGGITHRIDRESPRLTARGGVLAIVDDD